MVFHSRAQKSQKHVLGHHCIVFQSILQFWSLDYFYKVLRYILCGMNSVHVIVRQCVHGWQ